MSYNLITNEQNINKCFFYFKNNNAHFRNIAILSVNICTNLHSGSIHNMYKHNKVQKGLYIFLFLLRLLSQLFGPGRPSYTFLLSCISLILFTYPKGLISLVIISLTSFSIHFIRQW